MNAINLIKKFTKVGVVYSLLLGLILFLNPMSSEAIYPSGGGLPEAGLQRSFQDSAESREAFKEEFPFYERDEDGKPITSEFVKYDLSGYDLSGINLQGALFSVSTLRRANLEEANLENAIAYATHFEEANLKNTVKWIETKTNIELFIKTFDNPLVKGSSGPMTTRSILLSRQN